MALKPWEEEKGKERKGLEGGRDGVVGTHSFYQKGACGVKAEMDLRDVLIGVVGLNKGRLLGGGDVNRASRFGLQVIPDIQGLLAFPVVSFKVRTKGDQSSSPLPQARLLIPVRTLIHSFVHDSVLIRYFLHVLVSLSCLKEVTS